MTRSVKVGDKVRVVNPIQSGGQYKNGDVLTVEQVLNGGIIAEKVSRPLVDREYELYEPIKVGDTVTLIDNFYNHEAFKAEPRIRRKSIASLRGKSFDVSYINKSSRVSGTCKIAWSIPLDLLRKVDDGINAEWIATGVVDDGVIKGTDEPKKGDLFKVIGNDGHHLYSVGDVVEFLEVASERSYLTYCPKTGRTQFVHKTDLKPYDGINRHTPEQVAEAQRIIGKIVAGFRNFECFFIRDESDRELSIYYTKEVRDGMHTITAHCSPHDEFNRTIGLLVALCKATGRKLPDWV